MSTETKPSPTLYGNDGLHEWLEDLHRVGREKTESSILAHLLRRCDYRQEFLSACGIDWPAGTHATVRCEVPLDGGGVADLDVQWNHQGPRRLLIEHKPWAPFTQAQPANYLRQLKEDPAPHAAFVLLVGDGGKVDLACRHLLKSQVVPTSGSSWSSIEGSLRALHQSRLMKYRLIHKVVASLRNVNGPPLHQALVDFWISRQPLEPLVIAEQDKTVVETRLQELRLVDCETYEDKQRFGVYLHWEAARRHTELIWFGVAPRVAAQLSVSESTTVVVRGGQLPPGKSSALSDWAAHHGLAWQPVQAGTRIAEGAVALEDPRATSLLDDLASRLKLRRRRGKK